MSELVISRADPHSPLDLGQLETQSIAEGYRFLDRALSEWNDRSNRFDRPGEALFLARQDETIVGVAGLSRDPFLDDPSVGRLRRVYVTPSLRGLGIGKDMVTSCLQLAVGHFDRVRLRAENPGAARLYERLGFVPVDEENATHSMTFF